MIYCQLLPMPTEWHVQVRRPILPRALKLQDEGVSTGGGRLKVEGASRLQDSLRCCGAEEENQQCQEEVVFH